MVNEWLMLDKVVVIGNFKLQAKPSESRGNSMFSDLSSPLYVLTGAAFFTLLTYVPWPKIRLQTERQTCHGIQVTDIMLSISGQRRSRTGAGNDTADFEGAIYIIWKKRKK